MATHSSILACKILWTEMPGRLQFMGSQTLRDWHRSFLVNLNTVFHDSSSIFHSQQQCTKFPLLLIFVHTCHFSFFSDNPLVWHDSSWWFWITLLWWLVMLSTYSGTCWPYVCLSLGRKKCLFSSSTHFSI